MNLNHLIVPPVFAGVIMLVILIPVYIAEINNFSSKDRPWVFFLILLMIVLLITSIIWLARLS